jgi:Trypsin
MKIKISSLIAFVLFPAASLMMLFGSPNTQSIGNPQAEPEVSVPGIVSTSSDNGGMRTRADIDLPSARYGAHIDLNQPSVTLEPVDARSLTLEPNQIGITRSVAVSPNTRAQKFVNPDGSQLIVLVIKSSGASGTGVHFRNFSLADGDEVYVYGTAPDTIVFGLFTEKGPWGSGEFWSGTVDGDTAVIEFYKRAGENGQGFEISEVSHVLAELDRRLRFNEPDVLACEVDASCNRVNENNAVGRFTYIPPDQPGVMSFCTGTLLSNSGQNQTPLFLTANHCISTPELARTVELYWFYQTTACNSGVLRRDWVHSPPGATLLATDTDITLLRLQNSAPAGAFFSGWTSAAQSTGTRVFGLHNPDDGIPDEIKSYLRRADGSITSTNGSCRALADGYRIDWTSGLTEPGSSGSGLFTSNDHKLVGVLSCGITACSNSYDFYSKFSAFYPQIRQYLNSQIPSPPVANPATFKASYGFRANWRSVNGASGYRLDVATNNSFTNYVTGYQNRNVGNDLEQQVTGLRPSTPYFYRVHAYNEHGTSGNSNVVSVTTLPPTGWPILITEQATLITSRSAKLIGYVNPHGYSTTVYFEYGRTVSYGSRTPNQTKSGNGYQNVGATISGLSPGTTYHFRIVGTNQVGTRYGDDKTFTTR